MYPSATVFAYREADAFDICEGRFISLPEYDDRVLVVVTKMLLERGVTVTTDEGMLLSRATLKNTTFFWNILGIRPNSATGRMALETISRDHRPKARPIPANSDRSLRYLAEQAGMDPSEDVISTDDESLDSDSDATSDAQDVSAAAGSAAQGDDCGVSHSQTAMEGEDQATSDVQDAQDVGTAASGTTQGVDQAETEVQRKPKSAPRSRKRRKTGPLISGFRQRENYEILITDGDSPAAWTSVRDLQGEGVLEELKRFEAEFERFVKGFTGDPPKGSSSVRIGGMEFKYRWRMLDSNVKNMSKQVTAEMRRLLNELSENILSWSVQWR